MASEHPITGTEPFALGAFRVDPSRRLITGTDGETTVEPKIMAVLQMLAARPGEVVTRQEFIETIWATEYGGDETPEELRRRARQPPVHRNGAQDRLPVGRAAGFIGARRSPARAPQNPRGRRGRAARNPGGRRPLAAAAGGYGSARGTGRQGFRHAGGAAVRHPGRLIRGRTAGIRPSGSGATARAI